MENDKQDPGIDLEAANKILDVVNTGGIILNAFYQIVGPHSELWPDNAPIMGIMGGPDLITTTHLKDFEKALAKLVE